MRINRACKICGNSFSAIKTTQFFCCRKCFKRDYYLRTKAKITEGKQNPAYPTRKCSYCGISSQLSFDPLVAPQLFNAWSCFACGATNGLIWEHRNNPNSYQVITEILVTFQLDIQREESPVPTYETYRLPIPKLGQEDPRIVVMPCETMNIMEIQKRDRKKLLFS